jgi:hypothetical protein
MQVATVIQPTKPKREIYNPPERKVDSDAEIKMWEGYRENYESGKWKGHLSKEERMQLYRERLIGHRCSLTLGRDFNEDPDAHLKRIGLKKWDDWAESEVDKIDAEKNKPKPESIKSISERKHEETTSEFLIRSNKKVTERLERRRREAATENGTWEADSQPMDRHAAEGKINYLFKQHPSQHYKLEQISTDNFVIYRKIGPIELRLRGKEKKELPKPEKKPEKPKPKPEEKKPSHTTEYHPVEHKEPKTKHINPSEGRDMPTREDIEAEAHRLYLMDNHNNTNVTTTPERHELQEEGYLKAAQHHLMATGEQNDLEAAYIENLKRDLEEHGYTAEIHKL